MSTAAARALAGVASSASAGTSRGFKQTEVGLIPEEWEVRPLASICSSITDGTHYTPHYVSDGIPFYSVENVTADNFADTKFITQKEHDTLIKRCRPKKGDILLTRIGSLGDTKLIDWDVDASIYVSLALLKPNGLVDTEYLYRYTKSEAVVRSVEKRSLLNATPKKINMNEIGEIPIPVPATATEQEAIAEALNDACTLIESLEQLITKKRAIKQGAMRELLTGKRRLPGFNGEWRRETIGQVAEVKTGPFGSALHERDYVSDGTPIITVEHLGDAAVMHRNLPQVSESDRRILGAYSLQLFDIVFSRVGSVDRNALIRELEVGWLFSGRLLRLRFNQEVAFPPFFSHYFQTEPFKGRVRSVAVGQTMASLNTRLLGGVMVEMPPLEEQCAIAAILSDMDDEITSLETRLAKARQIKQGMMQELLTGRVRLL